MDKIEYSEDKNISYNDLNALLMSVGWRISTANVLQMNEKLSICYISAWKQKKLIGFGRLFPTEWGAILYDLIVNPEFQNKGIAKLIVQKLEEKAVKQGIEIIMTDTDNEIAKKLFIGLGFKQACARYRSGFNKIFYEKYLNHPSRVSK